VLDWDKQELATMTASEPISTAALTKAKIDMRMLAGARTHADLGIESIWTE
jgi:hypothetical protein